MLNYCQYLLPLVFNQFLLEGSEFVLVTPERVTIHNPAII